MVHTLLCILGRLVNRVLISRQRGIFNAVDCSTDSHRTFTPITFFEGYRLKKKRRIRCIDVKFCGIIFCMHFQQSILRSSSQNFFLRILKKIRARKSVLIHPFPPLKKMFDPDRSITITRIRITTSYNVSTIWKWFCDVARRSGAAHRLIGIKRDNNVWLTCNWTTLDNPIGLYTNSGRFWMDGCLIAVYTSLRFRFNGRNSLHDPLPPPPPLPPRNCLIRSAGQKIRMGSSDIIPVCNVTVQIVDGHRKYEAASVVSGFHA